MKEMTQEPLQHRIVKALDLIMVKYCITNDELAHDLLDIRGMFYADKEEPEDLQPVELGSAEHALVGVMLAEFASEAEDVMTSAQGESKIEHAAITLVSTALALTRMWLGEREDSEDLHIEVVSLMTARNQARQLLIDEAGEAAK